LLRSVQFAKEVGATHMTTTLLMSPKKEFLMLKESGHKVCQGSGVEFLPLDYRKGGGTQEMFRLSREMELYHQDYCGCIYGLFKQKKGEVQWDLVSFGRRPGSKEEILFIKELRLFAQRELFLPCKEWEFGFINWKLLSGKIEVGGQTLPSLVKPYSSSIRGVLKADPVERVGDIIYYNKGGLKVVLVEDLREDPPETFEGLCDPTFLVPRSFEDLLLKSRAVATLQTEITPDKSSLLLIGSIEAREILYLPADTSQDGRGLDLPWVQEVLSEERKAIVSEERAYLVVGAYTLGKAGLRYFQERTGRRAKPLLGSQSS
ncbi:MAG: epoxyqueuosine reductase QueH, partial [Aquificaceae bacterium]|nr:epoxyqueuosine reductase QueH [Aquificaceae bacterium]